MPNDIKVKCLCGGNIIIQPKALDAICDKCKQPVLWKLRIKDPNGK